MVRDVSRRSVLKGVGAGIAAAATATAGEASTMDGGEYLVGINGGQSVQRVTEMANRHEKTIDLGSVRKVVHAEFPAWAAQGLQEAAEGTPLRQTEGCTATERTVMSGDSAYGDAWTGSYRAKLDTCEISVELSADSPQTDFDLYVSLDGRTPTPDDFDRRAASTDGTESITLESVSGDATVGLRVESYQGSGSFELEVVETGARSDAPSIDAAAIEYVEENGTFHALDQSVPWGVDRVDADAAHSSGETGDGADVAILDTGIDADHPDLQANLGAGKAFTECSGSDCQEPWDDDGGHGTHCAGIADAVDDSSGVVGVSTNATLHALKVLGGDGSGSFADVAEAIRYTADQNWDVASMSLGASSGSSAVKDACKYAYDEGVLLVGAAGNDGECSDCVGYPAAYDEVIAVSSTDEDDSLSYFSSTGPEVELAAPGGDVYSTVPDGDYGTKSGTSMACPHVSGAGGQLMANGYTNEQARQRLHVTAEDIGLSSNEQGHGLLDVETAVLAEGFFLSTDEASNVSEVDATLNGTVGDLGGADSATVHFEWRQSGASSWNSTGSQTVSSEGSFSADISGLDSGTDYEFRAVGEAADGETNTGTVQTFSTDDGGWCFITTATAQEASTLNSLRRFRDESMSRTPVGRGLVGIYYRISPPIARALERHPESKTARACRRIVQECASMSDRQDDTDSPVESASIGVALTLLYVVGILVAASGYAGIALSELFER